MLDVLIVDLAFHPYTLELYYIFVSLLDQPRLGHNDWTNILWPLILISIWMESISPSVCECRCRGVIWIDKPIFSPTSTMSRLEIFLKKTCHNYETYISTMCKPRTWNKRTLIMSKLGTTSWRVVELWVYNSTH